MIETTEYGAIDVNTLRDPVIQMNGLFNADAVYTIYYDETNNIRRLHVRPDGLNVGHPECFVVGGIAYRGPVRVIDLDGLHSILNLQKSAKEIKLKHVAKGDFPSLLNAKKLEGFLQWLLDEGLFVHFSVLDPLYWSIVDVIDSILGEHGERQLFTAHMELKNDLYAILRHDLDGTVDLFQRYSYPDVGREMRRAFVAELRALLEQRADLLPHFNFMMLKGALQIAERLEALPFLEDETPNVLIDGFGPFFVQRICLFKNSEHIFDVEEVVKTNIATMKFVDGARKLTNYRFADSKDEPGVQVSDVITGLLGKMFTFLNGTTASDLTNIRTQLTDQQRRNLGLLETLLDHALEENPAFAHYTLSLEDLRRKNVLFSRT
ncbi:hypothetical protein JCM17844_29200 [Iodidimonas gelatinilytica]|uniref:DUF3800 domain-containing protein n=1 Tax=Iodidimonas gelatinilytica TaxID=1236966 RepID=A0A5A7MVC3_9PROT|nr:DUF3800 domain-containing protein [Iodidimonas gelatinilytica]GEQ99283.1 hypothetical protein JCM17844_29200 [Iodidimonas gelatinilytica]